MKLMVLPGPSDTGREKQNALSLTLPQLL